MRSIVLLRPITLLLWRYRVKEQSIHNKITKDHLENTNELSVFSKQIKYELWLRISIGFFLCHLSSSLPVLYVCIYLLFFFFIEKRMRFLRDQPTSRAHLYIGKRCKSSLFLRKICLCFDEIDAKLTVTFYICIIPSTLTSNSI